MPILESRFEEVADAIDAGDVFQHEYDVKFRILMKAARKPIPGKDFLASTLKTIVDVTKSGEILEILDINGNQIKTDLSGIEATDMEQIFCVEIGGTSDQIFMFGMQIRSTIPYAVLKERTGGLLKAQSTYMSLHRGGFEFGVNWATLGFFTEKHPKFVNHDDIRDYIVEQFVSGWKTDRNYWTSNKKKEIQSYLNTKAEPFDPSAFPLLVTSTTTVAKDTTSSVRSYTVSVSTPHKFARIGRLIMDYLLLTAKVLHNYVPLAFQYEDQVAFRNILKAHETWLENHRNIQICNVPTTQHWKSHPAADGTTLKKLLDDNPNIRDVNFDSKHSRLNVSVDRKNFANLSNALSEQLSKAGFSFQPTVRKVTTHSATNSTGSTNTTASKYSHILSGMISSATSQASSNHTTATYNRKNAWNQRVPSTIDFYGNSSVHFPPLRPTSPSADSQSQATTSDGITASTLQSAIQEALAEVKRNHDAEIQAMKESILSLQEQLAHRNQTTTDRLEKKIDLLMQQLALGPDKNNDATTDDVVPSPFRKKQRNEQPDSHPQNAPSSHTDDLGWSSDEEDKVPSSQDGAEASSGSET